MSSNQNRDQKEVTIKALRPFGTTVFTEMTALANANGAVNLSQGFPDFDGPEEIRKKAAEAIIRGPNQYAPSIGIPQLRQAVSHRMKHFYDITVDPDLEVTVTSGATEGICATLFGILEPEDEIILLEPWFDSYPPVAAMSGAKIRYVSLELPDFSLPREKLEKAFNSKTKAIVINSPHNPTGKVFTREELELMAELCVKHDAYVVSDEVYEHLVYGGHKHVTALSVPGLRDRAFVVSSTAKTFSMTGWKIGRVVAAPELSHATRMSHQFIIFCGQSTLQEAMAFAMDFPDAYYEQLLAGYTRRRQWLCEALADLGFNVFTPEGTYYVVTDITPLGIDDDLDFCMMLPEKAGVAAIPCSYFWDKRARGRHLVRWCFCKRDETLDEGIRRLNEWLK